MEKSIFKEDIIGSIPDGVEQKLIYTIDPDYGIEKTSLSVNSSVGEIGELNHTAQKVNEDQIEVDLLGIAEEGFGRISEKVVRIIGGVENEVVKILENPDSWEIIYIQNENRGDDCVIESIWRPRKDLTYKEKAIGQFRRNKGLSTESFISQFSFSILHIIAKNSENTHKEDTGKLTPVEWKKEAKPGREEILNKILSTPLNIEYSYIEEDLFKYAESGINKLLTEFRELQEINDLKYSMYSSKFRHFGDISTSQIEVLEQKYRDILNTRNISNTTSSVRSVLSNYDLNYGKVLGFIEYVILRNHFEEGNFEKFFNFLRYTIQSNSQELIVCEYNNDVILGRDDLWSMRFMLLISGLFMSGKVSKYKNIRILKKVYGDFCLRMLETRLPFILERIGHLKAEERVSFLGIVSTGEMPNNLDEKINSNQDLAMLYEVFQMLVYGVMLKGSMEFSDIQKIAKKVILEKVPGEPTVKESFVDSFIAGPFQKNIKKIAPMYGQLIIK